MTSRHHLSPAEHTKAIAGTPHRFPQIHDAFDARMVAAVKADIAWQKAQRHERLRAAIRQAAAYPETVGYSRYFRFCPGGFAMSVDEGIAELSRSIRINRSVRKRSPHFPLTHHTPSLVEALTFARFLRRFGARLSVTQAKAA